VALSNINVKVLGSHGGITLGKDGPTQMGIEDLALVGGMPTFVMLAGIASVVGHNWMLFLKFTGGKGMGAAFGALFVLMPVYGYPQGLAILFGIILIPFIITRNVALSMSVGLLSLPLITWFGTHSGIGTIMAALVGIIILIKFLPTAKAAWTKSKNKKEFVFDRWQRKKKAG